MLLHVSVILSMGMVCIPACNGADSWWGWCVSQNAMGQTGNGVYPRMQWGRKGMVCIPEGNGSGSWCVSQNAMGQTGMVCILECNGACMGRASQNTIGRVVHILLECILVLVFATSQCVITLKTYTAFARTLLCSVMFFLLLLFAQYPPFISYRLRYLLTG